MKQHDNLILGQPPLVLPEKGKDKKFLFLLGADDPEMEQNETMLARHGQLFLHATCNGERVNPGNVYKADPVIVPEGHTLVLVECEPREFIGNGYRVQIADHHRNGDPGFNILPKDFLLGSSWGQLCLMLDIKSVSEYELIIAALDHCPTQAMLGACPGVDPARAKLTYQQLTAQRRSVSLGEVHACMRMLTGQIARAPLVRIGNTPVIDTTSIPTGIGYSLEYVCSIGVAVELKIPILVSNRNGKLTPEKIVLTGAVTPELVGDFRTDYAVRHNLINVWGDNNRGAGGNRP